MLVKMLQKFFGTNLRICGNLCQNVALSMLKTHDVAISFCESVGSVDLL